jgi:hypothetical protein
MALQTVVKRFWRSIPGGAGVNSVAISLKKHSDNTEITSASTAGSGAAAGLATMTSTYMGPQYATGTNAGTTLYSSSSDVGLIGTMSGYDLDVLGLSFIDGVVDGYLNEAAVTATGSNMILSIDTGAFILRGHPYRNSASANVTVTANATGSTRIDRVVIRHYPKGTANEGHAEFAILVGTTSAPAVTQSAAVWEVSLAQVSVANGATSISQGNVTDERPYTGPVAAGSVISALLALKAPLASPTFTGTVNAQAISAAGISATSLGTTGAVTAGNGLTVTAGTVNFPAGAIDAADIGGGNVSDTEFDFLNGVTSAIQTQIDANTSAVALKAPAANPTFTGTVTAAGATFNGIVRVTANGDPDFVVEGSGGNDIFYVSQTYNSVHTINGAELSGVDGAAGVGTKRWILNSATGDATFLGSVEIDGALNHDGTTIGFFGTGASTQAAALSAVTTKTAGLSYDADEQAMMNNFKLLINEIKAVLERYGLTP